MSPKDFEQLCKSIEGSLSKVMNAVEKGLDKASDAANNAINQAVEHHKQQSTRDNQSAQAHQPRAHETPSAFLNRRATDPNAQAMYRSKSKSRAIMKSRFKSSSGLMAGGIALTTVGGVLSTTFVTAEAIALLTLSTLPAASTVPEAAGIGTIVVLGIFAGLSVGALIAGIKRISLASRFKAFQRIFGEREVCSIKELSERTLISPPKTLSTARKLIAKGFIPQGRLDADATCLMVTNESYNLYLQAKQAYEQRLMEEQATRIAKERAGIQASSASATLESTAFLKAGNDYLQELRALDAAIDDVELSRQIVQIETIIERILKRVENNPKLLESVSGLDRLNTYYLPQTTKLLSAYEELEEQPIQGDNIINSRREIEKTLRVLCTAYDKLLDSTFEDLSMDVSADITVLHAVLAQEGLTENPFNTDDDRPEPKLN